MPRPDTGVATAAFLERLGCGAPVILDGPMGTELGRRGVDTGLPLWSAWGLVRAPELVVEIHRDHLRAGAEVVTTNTFRTHARSLARAGMGDRARELTTLAVTLARSALAEEPARAEEPAVAKEPVLAEEPGGPARRFVAGSVSPLEDCYSPQLTPGEAELHNEHAAMVDDLEVAGVDLYLVETMPTVREAVAAAGAAVQTGRPVLVGLTCTENGALVSGESVEAAVAALEPLEPAALLINCTASQTLHRALERLRAATHLPVGAYGNVGHAEKTHGWAATDVLRPEAYADLAERWLRIGVRLVGTCCGTTPDHLRAVAARAASAAFSSSPDSRAR